MIARLLYVVELLLSYLYTLKCVSKSCDIGKGSVVYYRSSLIYKKGRISIGNECIIGRTRKNYHVGMPFFTTLLVDAPNAFIKIGDNTRINGAYIHAKIGITIGDKCVIASGVNVIDSNGHILNSLDRTLGRDIPKEIIIGNNVWIGLNVTILKGTIIGDNSVVSAGSIVKGVFPNNSLIQGNPATLVKKLDMC